MVMAAEITRGARELAELVLGLPIPPMRLWGSGDAKGSFWGADRVTLYVPDWQTPQDYAAEFSAPVATRAVPTSSQGMVSLRTGHRRAQGVGPEPPSLRKPLRSGALGSRDWCRHDPDQQGTLLGFTVFYGPTDLICCTPHQALQLAQCLARIGLQLQILVGRETGQRIAVGGAIEIPAVDDCEPGASFGATLVSDRRRSPH